MSLGQPQPHVCVSAVMTKEVHTLNTPRSRRKLVLTATAHDWVLVVRAHRRHVHHCGHDEIWRESANTTLLKIHDCFWCSLTQCFYVFVFFCINTTTKY